MKQVWLNKKSGLGLVEVIVGIAVLAIVLLALSTTYSFYVKNSIKNTGTIKASYLLEEAIEAVKSMRDDGWALNIVPLSLNTNHYLEYNSGSWMTTTTPEYVDGTHLRLFKLFEVKRDGNDDIADAGTVDTDTLRLDVTVSWPVKNATSTKTISTYITNLFDN